MQKTRSKTKEIRDFIIENVTGHPANITTLTSKKFNISRQAVLRHIKALKNDKILNIVGKTKDRKYILIAKDIFDIKINLSNEIHEDKIWRVYLYPKLKNFKKNVVDICHYGFTEMVNNVIDHSGAKSATISVEITVKEIKIVVYDEGIGIFRKIKHAFNLDDEQHAILELSKGKLTTDPERHTGEGIFFTSRMFDTFSIISSNIYFGHENAENDWLIQSGQSPKNLTGTYITLIINTNSNRTLKEVFDEFASEDEDYHFNQTIVPVKLAQYGNENLISRSQAKRLLARFDIFKNVILDFQDIEFIGRAFADEIFRVFKKNNPEINILHVRANHQVGKMIERAQKN